MKEAQDRLVGVATDDNIMTHHSIEQGLRGIYRFESEAVEANLHNTRTHIVPLHTLLWAWGATCVALDTLSALFPELVCRLWESILCLIVDGHGTPCAVQRCLGALQWLALLTRVLLIVYQQFYRVVEVPRVGAVVLVLAGTLNELPIGLVLLPLATVDTSWDCLPLLLATDAAPDFGFGVSRKDCSRAVAEAIVTMSEKTGDYVRLFQEPGDAVRKERLGNPHHLQVCQSELTTLISSKARFSAHSGVLEAWATLLGLRCISRSASRSHSRLAMLVGAKVVVCIVSKGRASSKSLNRIMRKVAALALPLDVHIIFVYIPSEDKPADGPSRGVRRLKRRSVCRSKPENKIRDYEANRDRAFRRLRETGMLKGAACL